MDNQTHVDVAPEPKPRPARRLEYDDTRPTGISRRQMNVFLLLLFINTLLFAAFICLPNVSPLLKDLWSNWQSAREEKRVAKQLRTAIDACLTFTLPPDQVVYAEAPADVEKFLAGTGHAHVVSDRPPQSGGGGGGGSLFPRSEKPQSRNAFEQLLPQAGWREPVVLGRPEPMRRLGGRLLDIPRECDDDSVVFLHQLKTPSGKTRLVWISADAQQSLNENTGDERATTPHPIDTDRTLSAVVYNPDDLHSPTLTTIRFAESPDARSRTYYYRTDDGVLRTKPWEPRGLWRILAGQSDPADPAHATIPYDIDGKPGVIDARLGDGDRLIFTPRAGRLVQWTGSNTYTWDLTAPSTSQPTK